MPFPHGSAGKESACNVGDLGSISGLGRSPGEGNDLPTPVFWAYEGNGLPAPVFWPGEFHRLFSPWGHKQSDMTHFHFHLGFPGVLEAKASACSAGDPGSMPELGRSPGEGNGNPLQSFCLENPMDGGSWEAAVYGVAKSRTRLGDFTSSLA